MIIGMSPGVNVVFVVGYDYASHSEFNMRFNDDHFRYDTVYSIPDPVIVTVDINGH